MEPINFSHVVGLLIRLPFNPRKDQRRSAKNLGTGNSLFRLVMIPRGHGKTRESMDLSQPVKVFGIREHSIFLNQAIASGCEFPKLALWAWA